VWIIPPDRVLDLNSASRVKSLALALCVVYSLSRLDRPGENRPDAIEPCA
jgi:hypothetical protein